MPAAVQPSALQPGRACRVATGALLLAGLACQASAASLCQHDTEQTVFACSTGRKLIAVCGATGWSARAGYLHYRFGTPNKLELQVPAGAASPTPPGSTAQWGLITLSGGGGATLRFSSGTHDYTVYSATSARGGDKAGVEVQARGKRVAVVRCKLPDDAAALDINALQAAGLPEDPQPFELP